MLGCKRCRQKCHIIAVAWNDGVVQQRMNRSISKRESKALNREALELEVQNCQLNSEDVSTEIQCPNVVLGGL